MLLVLAALPAFVVVAGVLSEGAPFGWPLLIVSAPAALVGLLYLLSATFSKARQARQASAQYPEQPAAT